MRTRWSAYAGVSVALAGGVVVKSLAQRPNFYSAAVYLSQSSANLMILTNMVFVVACSILLGLQKLLYGPLRPIEIEQLYEKAWFAVTETCLAMTIFRGEIGAWFLVMFFALLAGKVWTWIGEGRVEILEQQPPRNPRLFHTRLSLSLGLSVFFSLSMLEYVIKEVMHMARPDMMVMFGFEFAVLSLVSLSTAARYAINLVEIGIVRKQKAKRAEEIRKERVEAATRNAEQTVQQASSGIPSMLEEPNTATTPTASPAEIEQRVAAATDAMSAILTATNQPIDEADLEVEGWEGKGRWVFYLDLATDFFKLVVYLSFFFILLVFYGLPIHILRDVFMTCRSFFKRIADFMRYRTATRDMNDRYPDATENEIGSEDVCIICREEMRPYQPTAPGQQTNPVAERMRPKKLPCGHILHFSCLRSWLERQQICPTCRTSVVPTGTARTGPTNAAGVPGPEGQHGNAPAGNGAAARVYRIGPLRIGVGAARGNNMLEDLQNRLGDQEPRDGAQANANGAQQFGIGIRWDGMRRRDRERRSRRPVQDQLDSAERQIQRELNSLGGSLAELQVLRGMESELARIRALRQNNGQVQPGGIPSASTLPRAEVTVTPLVGNQQNTLQAGNEALPAGLTLPEGWSMMPLQPHQGAIPHLQAQALPLPMQFPASAMFTMPGQVLQNGQFPTIPQHGSTLQHMPLAVQPHAAQMHVNHIPIPQNQNAPAPGLPNALPYTNGNQDLARNMADIMANQTRAPSTGSPSSAPAASASHGWSAGFPSSVRSTSGEADSSSHAATTLAPSAPLNGHDQTNAPTPSLPIWGSGSAHTHDTAPTSSAPSESSRTNGHSTGETTNSSDHPENSQSGNEPSSSTKKRSATVEDLVEDPD